MERAVDIEDENLEMIVQEQKIWSKPCQSHAHMPWESSRHDKHTHQRVKLRQARNRLDTLFPVHHPVLPLLNLVTLHLHLCLFLVPIFPYSLIWIKKKSHPHAHNSPRTPERPWPPLIMAEIHPDCRWGNYKPPDSQDPRHQARIHTGSTRHGTPGTTKEGAAKARFHCGSSL